MSTTAVFLWGLPAWSPAQGAHGLVATGGDMPGDALLCPAGVHARSFVLAWALKMGTRSHSTEPGQGLESGEVR